jgi:RimJ/RimL family protein N-acetyltransferase
MSIPDKHIDNVADVNIRLAAISDALLLWRWANDPVTRTNSFNSQPISWDVHQSWYANKLKAPDCRIWIMELGRMPIAQIRYDRISADMAQISFSVAPLMRGRGLGTLLLEMTLPMAAGELRVKWVRGVALRENKASQRAFAKASFTMTEPQLIDSRECLLFQRSLKSIIES